MSTGWNVGVINSYVKNVPPETNTDSEMWNIHLTERSWLLLTARMLNEEEEKPECNLPGKIKPVREGFNFEWSLKKVCYVPSLQLNE
jgi:hypothetical protein